MGLIPPNHGPQPGETLASGTLLVATRDVEVMLDRVRHGTPVVLTAQSRLRYLRSAYTAECIPPIEYADVYCEALTGDLAGRLIVLLTFEMDAPVPERSQLAERFGIILDQSVALPPRGAGTG
jgi:hypothetical protein